MERPHRELGARLADRLGGDDADRLAQLGQAAGSRGRGRSTAADAALGASQVRVERMRTRSRPESSIFWASSSVISLLAWTMISSRADPDVLGG